MTVLSKQTNVHGDDTSESEGTLATVAMIDPSILQGLIATITNKISAGTSIGSEYLADRTAAVAATASTHYSSSIDMYDYQTMNPYTKDGKYHWAVIIRKIDGWMLCTVNVENSYALMELFRDRQVTFGLDPIMNILLNGTVFPSGNPRSVTGVDHWSADLHKYKALLKDIHVINIDHVQAFSSWFMGN